MQCRKRLCRYVYIKLRTPSKFEYMKKRFVRQKEIVMEYSFFKKKLFLWWAIRFSKKLSDLIKSNDTNDSKRRSLFMKEHDKIWRRTVSNNMVFKPTMDKLLYFELCIPTFRYCMELWILLIVFFNFLVIHICFFLDSYLLNYI